MKSFATSIFLMAAVASANANCFGSDAFKTCTDNSGNSYTVQKFGDTTTVQGRNAQGDTWSQRSQTLGNTTYHNGTAANGNNWNGTTSTYGGTTVNQGIDSNGQIYRKTCNQYGCY